MDPLTKSTLSKLLSFSTSMNETLFVVGGTLRNILSRYPCTDFDLTGKNAAKVGVNFSRSLSFTSVSLDTTPGRKTTRVILNQNKHLDFTDLQGRDIFEDLSQRDFTINAMGLLLQDFLSEKQKIIDPHDGQSDLTKQVIRVLDGPIFLSDPLRMLRAFRFAATLKFHIDADTLTKISKYKHRIGESSPERIWQELNIFLRAPATLTSIRTMQDCGLLDCLLPASGSTLSHYEKVESLLNNSEITFPKFADKFNTNTFFCKHYLLKLSVLKKVTHECNLQLSNAESKLVKKTLKGARSLTKVYLKGHPKLNEIYELTKNIHEELLASIVLFITDTEESDASKRILFSNQMLSFYFEHFLPAVNKKPLLNGKDIIRRFQLSPSPLFGKILRDIQRAQVLGNISTSKDAIVMAKNIIKSQTKESNG